MCSKYSVNTPLYKKLAGEIDDQERRWHKVFDAPALIRNVMKHGNFTTLLKKSGTKIDKIVFLGESGTDCKNADYIWKPHLALAKGMADALVATQRDVNKVTIYVPNTHHIRQQEHSLEWDVQKVMHTQGFHKGISKVDNDTLVIDGSLNANLLELLHEMRGKVKPAAILKMVMHQLDSEFHWVPPRVLYAIDMHSVFMTVEEPEAKEHGLHRHSDGL